MEDTGNAQNMGKNPELDSELDSEKKLNRKQIAIFAVMSILTLLLIPLALFLSGAEEAYGVTETAKGSVKFSLPSGFYDSEIRLRLSSGAKGDILYTLDGSAPGRDNGASVLYGSGTGSAGEGILLECGGEETVYTVRAALMPEDGAEPTVQTAVYVVGRRVKDRYDLPALFVSGEPADLLDEETGIFVGENRLLRGREYEKPVQATLFDVQGNAVFSQGCGLRIHGGATRMKNQPSFRLYARKEYDEENRFRCLLFEDYSVENTLVTGCKSVIVRNGGDDHGYAHLRTEFASRVCSEAGFPDAAASSPVCVYINGEYFGVYWFVENYDDSYFEKKYGGYDGEMVVMEGVVSYLQAEEGDDELTLQLKEDYNQFHEYIAYADLNDEANWQALNAVIDVDNFLYYMAIQNYLANADVLVNNFKTYRYYAPDGDYREGTVFDGRYRFLLYDLDETLGYVSMDSTAPETNVLSTSNRVGYDIFYNALFANIMKRPEGRELYIRYYLSLLNYWFSDRASLTLYEMHASHEAELYYQYTEMDMMSDNFETPQNVEYDHVIEELGEIQYFLQDRPGWALIDLEEAFGLSGQYSLVVQNDSEAEISVDFATFHDKEYTGTYFSQVPVTVKAVPKCGEWFDYWLVDGEVYYDETLVITADMLRDDVLYLECVTSPNPDMGLWISAVKSRGGNDYVKLTNFGPQTVDLAEYTLADGADERNKSTLPSLLVEPGKSVMVYCKNYAGAEAIGQPAVNFNIKAGEVLHLYRGRLLQQVSVPRLGTRDGVLRLDIHNGKFYEKKE